MFCHLKLQIVAKPKNLQKDGLGVTYLYSTIPFLCTTRHSRRQLFCIVYNLQKQRALQAYTTAQ